MYESVSSISESSQLYLFNCSYPLDLANYIKDNGGEKKILADQAVKQYLENLKVTMLIQKLEETDLNTLEKSQNFVTFVKNAARAIKTQNLSFEDSIKAIKEREFRIVAKVKQ